jgi:hypothetical protein
VSHQHSVLLRVGIIAAVGVFTLAACGSDDTPSAITDVNGTAATGGSGPAGTDTADSTPAANTPADTNAGGSSPEDTTADSTPTREPTTLAVPADYPTITEAVDAAVPGDLILISPGVYNEAVNVTTDELTIRGLDRNEVILDGELELDNGIRVLGAKGVAIENMTARNYTNNGFFWTGVDGYRGSYLTAARNGDYGIYAYDSTHGLLEHSYASGSPDAGFYIGQCFECDAVIDDVISEYNGLGYSGTTSGGNLYIINSRFNNNRAGINTNSATYELCYPQRQLTVVGNLVYSNNQPDTPAIDDAILAMGNGILVEGGIGNVIERNRVYDHPKTGIGIIPFAEFEPNDTEPSPDTWDQPCSETRNKPLADPESIVPIFWEPHDNSVQGNVVEASGVADLAMSAVATDLSIIDPTGLGNCFAGNTFTTSAPADIEALLPCEGTGSGGDYLATVLNVASWLDDVATAPPAVDYASAPTPEPPVLDGMPDAATAPANPAVNMPPKVDLAAITVPDKPAS